ncbi:MAG: ABC transporter ATP-binding protein [Polyangiaceae bacterium]
MSAAAELPMPAPLLDVSGLSIRFRTRSGDVRALEAVGFEVGHGQIVGVVGESGSGKSVLSLALMGLMDDAGRIDAGRAMFTGSGEPIDLLARSADEARPPLAMVFQSPRTALNPIRRVGDQLIDVLEAHGKRLDRKAARVAARSLLAQVKITDPDSRLAAYPFELSGGMCQRVMIALALACEPQLLIADEPTTGLDVTTQAAILELLRELSHRRGMSTMLITHDLGLASEYCDALVVMHAGHVVEQGPTLDVLARPRHPYTARLIAATPRAGVELEDLHAIPGQLPDLRGTNIPPCRFHGRCERALPGCTAPPVIPLVSVETSALRSPGSGTGSTHRVACRNPLP